MSHNRQKQLLEQENPHAPNEDLFQSCFKKIHDDAVMPEYQTTGSAGMDLVALEDTVINGVTKVRTGLAFRAPKGFYAHIYDRSSNPIKKEVHLANNVGIIDADYRGEIAVLLMPVRGITIIEKGERIAQLVLMPLYQRPIKEVDSLDDTERGAGCLGSTGA